MLFDITEAELKRLYEDKRNADSIKTIKDFIISTCDKVTAESTDNLLRLALISADITQGIVQKQISNAFADIRMAEKLKTECLRICVDGELAEERLKNLKTNGEM